MEENESHTLKERNKGEDTFMISMGTPAVKIADKLMNLGKLGYIIITGVRISTLNMLNLICACSQIQH